MLTEEIKQDISFELELLTNDNIKETLSRIHRLTELYARIIDVPTKPETPLNQGVQNSIIDFSKQLQDNIDSIMLYESRNSDGE